MPSAIVRIDWAPDWRQQLYEVGEAPLRKAADRVLEAMRVEIPKSADGSGDRPAGYAASKLRTLERGRMPTGEPYRDVGTDAVSPDGANYPAMLEYGTKPHVITPKAPGYPLRDKHGRVFGYRVQHPGTRPNRWAYRSSMVINGARL